MHHTPPHCAHIHCLVSISIQQALMNASECIFFPHGGIQWHTLASCTLSLQMPFCQTAPLLPAVTWQQSVMKYRWEGSDSSVIPLTSTSDVVGLHNTVGGITCGAALVYYYYLVVSQYL